MAEIRSHELVEALLLQSNPTDALKITEIARRTNLHMPAFCKAVRAEVGDSLLLEAALHLCNSNDKVGGKTGNLLEHCVQCTSSSCTHSDCLELRSMLSTMKSHAEQCTSSSCLTCKQWVSVRTKMLAARKGAMLHGARPAAAILKVSLGDDASFTPDSTAANGALHLLMS